MPPYDPYESPGYLGEYDTWKDPVWYAERVGMLAFYAMFYVALLCVVWVLGSTALFWKRDMGAMQTLVSATGLFFTGLVIECVVLSFLF